MRGLLRWTSFRDERQNPEPVARCKSLVFSRKRSRTEVNIRIAFTEDRTEWLRIPEAYQSNYYVGGRVALVLRSPYYYCATAAENVNNVLEAGLSWCQTNRTGLAG